MSRVSSSGESVAGSALCHHPQPEVLRSGISVPHVPGRFQKSLQTATPGPSQRPFMPVCARPWQGPRAGASRAGARGPGRQWALSLQQSRAVNTPALSSLRPVLLLRVPGEGLTEDGACVGLLGGFRRRSLYFSGFRVLPSLPGAALLSRTSFQTARCSTRARRLRGVCTEWAAAPH